MLTSPSDSDPTGLFASHPRNFHDNRYVYPVLSRRAGGVSLGVNLNPAKDCNFHCIYCQVDRNELPPREFVDLDRLCAELASGIELVRSGRLFEDEQFAAVPQAMRTLHDVAFSGDGEPTTFRNFDEVVARSAEIRGRFAPAGSKMVLITNASMFHRPAVKRALKLLDANNGEIWAKLDAGTEAYYRRVARSAIPFARILRNIAEAAQVRPLVIQSLFMTIEGEPPSPQEIAAYAQRLQEIRKAGGQIDLVQVYTVARPPAENYVGRLSPAQLEAIAETVRRETGLAVRCFA